MKPKMSVIGKNCLKYGFFVAIAFIVYFLIMRMIGLADKTGFRFFNYVILTVGIFVAMSSLPHLKVPVKGYLPSFFTGIGVSLCAAAIFAVFMFIYTSWIDPAFIGKIKDNIPTMAVWSSIELNPFIIAMQVASEIIALSVILSLAVSVFFQQYSPSIEKGKRDAEAQNELDRSK